MKGNIASITFNGKTTSYVYDGLSQLIRENNEAAGKTWTYSYDAGGNIVEKKEYAYTTGTLGTALDTIAYGYADTDWGDLLTSYDGQTIQSDEIGNMLSDGTWTYTWEQGRQLKAMSDGTTNLSFSYDEEGKRVSKTVGNTTWQYVYNGSNLVYMTDGTNYLYFHYDATGATGFLYNGDTYYYLKNAQGDVIGIADETGDVIAEYSYDAWGNPVTTTDNEIGQLNPIRYRGYYYDTETGLYYLMSRYYDPEMGRFINADILISTGQGLIGNNTYCYCNNSPLSRKDDGGKTPDTVFDIISLGTSIVEVVANPADPWSWIGLVGDIVDVAVPFVGGLGEVIDACKSVKKVVDGMDNAIDAAKATKKVASQSVGFYEIIYESGKNYVGKGPFSRAIQSAIDHTKEIKLNMYKGDVVKSITWVSAKDDRSAFIAEYIFQKNRGGPLSCKDAYDTYNKIWSPGMKYLQGR